MWKVTDTYEDGTIRCGEDRVEIHSYYAPFGTKTFPYTRVKGLQPRRTGLGRGRSGAQPASDPPKICQARRDFATRLRTR